MPLLLAAGSRPWPSSWGSSVPPSTVPGLQQPPPDGLSRAHPRCATLIRLRVTHGKKAAGRRHHTGSIICLSLPLYCCSLAVAATHDRPCCTAAIDSMVCIEMESKQG